MKTRAFNQEVREQVFTKVVETVAGKLYDPALNGVDWNRIAEERRNAIVMSDTPADFEARMNKLIRELHVSHAGFFSEDRPRAAAKPRGNLLHVFDSKSLTRNWLCSVKNGPTPPPCTKMHKSAQSCPIL